MSFIAMNRFMVCSGSEAEFETVWKSRESRLKELDGFREFRLLKGPEGEGYTLYSSHVIWDSRSDFEAWTKSEQFREAHKNAGSQTKKYELMGPPQFEGFETVLHEG
ncbi:Heme-degrading monooxygenase HmoB [Roseovarius albus]|uniref:Heme-degrading monooxygenase HmoB n=1 Tax=Roseovarius albus TaxID=1247867 RepID=A0A1X6YTR8_9RHOB|nr:antibiotic biosynthesis monooxygenase [Roseovarius albus]SLN30590.1 Heme-degrading monooxygenase HmoB [Roseovarius albus]